jgi:hypothetical protein
LMAIYNLKEQSFKFIQKKFFKKVLKMEKMTGDDWKMLIYGILSSAYMFYFLYLLFSYRSKKILTIIQTKDISQIDFATIITSLLLGYFIFILVKKLWELVKKGTSFTRKRSA